MLWVALRVAPFVVITAMAGAWWTALALVWLFALAHGVGVAVLRAVARDERDVPVVLSVAVGLAVAMLGALLLGVAGCASRGELLGVLIVASVLVRREIVRFVQRGAGCVAAAPPATLGVATAHGALLVLFAMYWIAALAPEVGPDALGFRMAGPVHWMRQGALVGLPEMLGSYGVCAGEALYLLALPVLGTEAAKLVQLGIAVLLLPALCREARVHRASALWIGFLFFASTLPWVQIAWGFVDLLQLFFVYAAVRAVLEGKERGRFGAWLIIGGVAAGAAAAVKLNGVFALGIAGVLAVLARRDHFAPRALLRIGVALGVPFTAVLAPWLVRSWLLTGNPVFPFANRVFQSALAPLDLVTIPFGTGHDLLGLLRLPLAAFWTPQAMVEIGTYHPGLLALLPLALLGLCARSLARTRGAAWLAAACLAGTLWALTDQNLRYGMFLFFFLAIAMAGGLASWEERLPRGAARALGAALALVAVLGLPLELLRPVSWLWQSTVSGPALPTSVVLGAEARADYLALRAHTAPCGAWLDRHRGTAARVWQVHGVRDHLWFAAPCTSLPHGVQPLVAPLEEILVSPALVADPDEILRRLRALGYTHLAYCTESNRLSGMAEEARTGVFGPAFVRRCLVPCAAHLDIELYALLPAPRTDAQLAAAAASERDALEGVAFAEVAGQGRVAARAPIEGEALYAIEVELAPPAAGRELRVMIEWRGAGDALALFWLRSIVPKADSGTFRFLQTAPATAQTAVVSLGGGGALARRVRLLHLAPAEPEPTTR